MNKKCSQNIKGRCCKLKAKEDSEYCHIHSKPKKVVPKAKNITKKKKITTKRILSNKMSIESLSNHETETNSGAEPQGPTETMAVEEIMKLTCFICGQECNSGSQAHRHCLQNY